MSPNTLPERERLARVRIGGTVRGIRKARGMTQGELADAVGKARTYIANIEAGRKPLPLPLLIEIADALNIDRRDITQLNWDAVA